MAANLFHIALLLAISSSEDKLKTCVDSHAESVAAIRTLSCKFTFINPRLKANGLYRQSGSDFNLKTTFSDGRTSTTTSLGGRSKALFQTLNKDLPLQGLVEVDNGDLATECDPYIYNLLHFYAPLKFRSELSEILAEPNVTCRYVGEVQRDNRKLERIKLSHSRADITIDLDPEVNYLARFVTLRSKLAGSADKHLMEQEVTEFVEPSPGVFYPARVHCTDTKTGQETWAIEFTDIKINEPISSDKFALKFPAGVQVMDKVNKKVFVTDASGELTLPALNKKDGRPIQMATEADPGVEMPPPASGKPVVDLEMPARPSDNRWVANWGMPLSVGLVSIFALLGVTRLAWRKRTSG